MTRACDALCRTAISPNANGVPAPSPGLGEERATLGLRDPHFQPQRGCSRIATAAAATPLGLVRIWHVSQGSSFLATLGWRTKRRWRFPDQGQVHHCFQMPEPSPSRSETFPSCGCQFSRTKVF